MGCFLFRPQLPQSPFPSTTPLVLTIIYSEHLFAEYVKNFIVKQSVQFSLISIVTMVRVLNDAF
jgi:hypothetical protein